MSRLTNQASESKRQIKVLLHPELHRKLHAIKLMKGISIEESIADALDLYFAGMRGTPLGEQLENMAQAGVVIARGSQA